MSCCANYSRFNQLEQSYATKIQTELWRMIYNVWGHWPGNTLAWESTVPLSFHFATVPWCKFPLIKRHALRLKWLSCLVCQFSLQLPHESGNIPLLAIPFAIFWCLLCASVSTNMYRLLLKQHLNRLLHQVTNLQFKLGQIGVITKHQKPLVSSWRICWWAHGDCFFGRFGLIGSVGPNGSLRQIWHWKSVLFFFVLGGFCAWRPSVIKADRWSSFFEFWTAGMATWLSCCRFWKCLDRYILNRQRFPAASVSPFITIPCFAQRHGHEKLKVLGGNRMFEQGRKELRRLQYLLLFQFKSSIAFNTLYYNIS